MCVKDYYELLGIPTNADANAIKKAFRQQALLHHPDKSSEGRQSISGITIYDINEAYETLSDPVKKKCYDNSRLGANVFLGGNSKINDAVVSFFKTFANIVTKHATAAAASQKNDAATHSKTKPPDSDCSSPMASNSPSNKPYNPPSNDNPNIVLELKVTVEDLFLKKIKKLVFKRFRNSAFEKKTIYVSLYNYEEVYVFNS